MKYRKIIAAAVIASAMLGVSAYADGLPAFPGAEGGGKYTLGARAKSKPSVYHVTNLNAGGSGSFADAVSKAGRIIVFDVGGTIELDGTLYINKSNLTILGQTAPGDGITFSGGDIVLGSNNSNIIIRYIRVRPSDKNGGEPDGFGGRFCKNVIIDHCSMSWSVDETMTFYAGSSESQYTPGSNMTVQNCISSESLRMSNHFKGAHGYGGIIGGTNSSWLNNLFAHHDSRSPRLDRELQNTDFSNNVIYDWGQTNSAYGAEPYSYNNVTQNKSIVNWENNYYKYGPATAAKLRSRIFDVSNSLNVKPYSSFYFNGNYVFGDESVTKNNKLGINNSGYADFLNSAVDMGEYSYTAADAGTAYNYVLQNAGATLPKRDAIDARIINDVKNQTGRIINNADEIGGFIENQSVSRVFEIPNDWKEENGMGNAKETDIVPSGDNAGYTWIEAYVNDMTKQAQLPSNPEITVLSPGIASVNDTVNGESVQNKKWTVINSDEKLNYNAKASAAECTDIEKMELYDKNSLIKSYSGAEINDEISLDAGTHYLTCRAYNNKGEMTQSTTSIVYVKSTAEPSDFEYTEIGDTQYSGDGGASLDGGIYTVSGAGAIYPGGGVKSDSCGFMYRYLKGDFDISFKMESIPKFENYEVSGIMVRSELEPSSQMAMIADGWLKYGENSRVIVRDAGGEKSREEYFKDSSGKYIVNDENYNTSESAYRVPKYMRVKRSGNEITFYVSDDGKDWTNNPRQPMTVTLNDLPECVYAGIAADNASGISPKEYFAMAQYSEMKFDGEEAEPTPIPTATPEPTSVPTATPKPTATPEPEKQNEIYEQYGFIHIKTVKSLTAYIASYDADGRLIYIKSMSCEAGKENAVSKPKSGNVKVMLWDDGEPVMSKEV